MMDCFSAPIEGLTAITTTGQVKLHLAFETPFAAWYIRNATQLPLGQVVFQLGENQVCILEPETRKVARISSGRGPVVVVQGLEMAASTSSADRERQTGAASLTRMALETQGEPDPWSKVELDLTALDEAGLRGPPDGKVAVAYEFAIPDTATHRAEIAAIDPTVQFMPGSRGRIGAGEGQCLCIGSTHQDNYQDWYWVRGRVDLDTSQGVARFYRDGAVVVTFDWGREEYTLHRLGRVQTRAQDWLPFGQSPF